MKNIEWVREKMNNTTEVKQIYRKPLYRIIGRVIKRGAGWVQIEECFNQYIWHTKNKDTGETESFEEFPFRTLICFPRDMGERLEAKGVWTDLDSPKVFTVRTTVDINNTTKRLEVKNWLEEVRTFDEFIKWIKDEQARLGDK